MPEKINIITSLSALKSLARNLAKSTVVACDLEADSMYHYKEKVCLLQLATEQVTAVVDPLAVPNLDPLKPLFRNPGIRKVFHGADYDVRSLYRDFQIEINNLFDTELACRFLGARSTGLEPVLKKVFGVVLDKKYQKRDWSRRPLPEAMLRYAARDTIYLVDLSKILLLQLIEKQRFTWVTEECEILSRVRATSTDNKPLYQKFKGAGRLSRRNLAVLEGLLQFRQSVAKKKDRPLFKVIGSDAIKKIVARRPVDMKTLKGAKALSPRQVEMFGSNIIDIIKTAMAIPPKELPTYPRSRPPALDPAVPNRIQNLKNWRDAKAKTLKMNPPLLLTKSLMATIAGAKPTHMGQFTKLPEMRDWQKEEFGKEIIALFKNTEQ